MLRLVITREDNNYDNQPFFHYQPILRLLQSTQSKIKQFKILSTKFLNYFLKNSRLSFSIKANNINLHFLVYLKKNCPGMKKLVFLFLLHFSFSFSFSQKIDPWKIVADKIDPSNYYGETVANGVIGIVSSADAIKM